MWEVGRLIHYYSFSKFFSPFFPFYFPISFLSFFFPESGRYIQGKGSETGTTTAIELMHTGPSSSFDDTALAQLTMDRLSKSVFESMYTQRAPFLN